MLEIFQNWFFIIPIVFLIITIILIIKLIKRNKEYVDGVGTITDFHKNTNEMRLNDCENEAISPIITYEVNGTKFDFIGNYYSTTMKVGDEIKIMYNPNNPKEATTKKGLSLAVVILGAFTIVSFIVLIVLQRV